MAHTEILDISRLVVHIASSEFFIDLVIIEWGELLACDDAKTAWRDSNGSYEANSSHDNFFKYNESFCPS